MTEILLKDIGCNSIEQLLELTEWCENQFGPSEWDRMYRWTGGRWWLDGSFSFKFTHSEDAMLFMLRWT